MSSVHTKRAQLYNTTSSLSTQFINHLIKVRKARYWIIFADRDSANSNRRDLNFLFRVRILPTTQLQLRTRERERERERDHSVSEEQEDTLINSTRTVN